MKPNRAAACRFFSHGQAVLFAMQAYAEAARAVEPPDGKAWFDEDGSPWSGYADWAREFCRAMREQVERCAIARRVPFESGSVFPELFWSLEGDFLPPENAPFATQDNRPDNRAGSGAGND